MRVDHDRLLRRPRRPGSAPAWTTRAPGRGACTAAAAALVAVAAFTAVVAAEPGGATPMRWIDDLATAGAAALAAALCFRAARRARTLRRFWLLLGAACSAWTLGEALWGVYDLVLAEPVPVPSWADVGYLAAIPFAAAALVSHPALRGRATGTIRSLLDGLVLATACFLVAWTVLLGPLWRSTDLTTAGGLVTVAYPLTDLVVLFLVVLVVRGAAAGGRADLWLLLGGLAAMSCSDGGYAYIAEVRGYDTGSLLDAGWFAGYLGIALSALVATGARSRRPEQAREPRLSPAAIVAPFLPVLAALALVAVRLQLGHRLDEISTGAAAALVALFLARQALLVFDLLAGRDAGAGPLGDRVVSALAPTGPRRSLSGGGARTWRR